MKQPLPTEIRAARARASLTQAEAGAIIDASRRTWQDWEAGKRKMPPAKWLLWRMLMPLAFP